MARLFAALFTGGAYTYQFFTIVAADTVGQELTAFGACANAGVLFAIRTGTRTLGTDDTTRADIRRRQFAYRAAEAGLPSTCFAGAVTIIFEFPAVRTAEYAGV